MKYETTISRNYVRGWDCPAAFREILQNAIDRDGDKITFEIEDVDDTHHFLVGNSGTLTHADLWLGNTSKADDEAAIGQFGEGLKLAMLVFARNGIEMQIYTNGERWTATIERSEKVDLDVLCVSIEPHESEFFEADHTYVCLSRVSRKDAVAMKAVWLPYSPLAGAERRAVPYYGEVIVEGKGAIFVNGLFVCEHPNMQHGYNFLPSVLRLDRDRSTVSTFDLTLNTSRMCYEAFSEEEVATMCFAEKQDVYFADANAPANIRDAVFDIFQSEFGQRAAVQGNHIFVSGTKVGTLSPFLSKIIAGSEKNRAALIAADLSQVPIDVLKSFFAKNRKHMRKDGIIAFRELMKGAHKWKV